MYQLFSSGVALVPPLDLRPNGLSIAKGGFVPLVPGNVVVCEGGPLDAVAGTPRYAVVDTVIQSHMTQKSMLRGKVDARTLRVKV